MSQKENHTAPTAPALRVYRTAASLTQQDLAAVADCSRRTIVRLEAGGRPSENLAKRLSRALATPVDVLFDADKLFPPTTANGDDGAAEETPT